jgi:hypothetical protein
VHSNINTAKLLLQPSSLRQPNLTISLLAETPRANPLELSPQNAGGLLECAGTAVQARTPAAFDLGRSCILGTLGIQNQCLKHPASPAQC